MVQRDNFTFSELEQWLNTHRVTEIECLVPDLTGVARGKILPREKFTEDRGMRLPEAVVAMGVTGEFPEEGPYYDVISPTDRDMHLQADPTTVRIVPWATDPTAQVIHDCYDKRRRAGALRAALGAAPRLRPVRGRGLEPGGGARARVLPGGAQHRPRHAAEAADRPQRPRRDLAPGLFDRRGQRVRPAVRGRLRLLREDGAERGHADPRGRRRADGDQLLPRPPAGPGRRGLPVQAHGARGRAAPRHVRHLHGQADRRRAGQRDARAPEPGQPGRPARTSSATPTARPARSSSGTSAGCRRYIPAAMALFAPYVNSYRRLVRSNAAPINIQWGTDNRTVGIRSPVAGPQARRIENRVIGADANPYVALAATLACGYLGIKNRIEPRPSARATPTWATPALPRSLGEALQLLRDEKDLAEVLGEGLRHRLHRGQGDRVRRVHEGDLALGARTPAAARLKDRP